MHDTHAPLFIDVSALSCGCTDHALETIYKSLGDPPGSDSIWTPHHDPFVSDTIESVTERGLRRLRHIETDLLQVVGGRPMAKAFPRWNDERITEVARQLSDLHPDQYTWDDWLSVVAIILQTYLPNEAINDEAEYLVARSALAGKIQAAIPDGTKLEKIPLLVAAIPTTLSAIEAAGLVSAGSREAARIGFARDHAAELIAGIRESARRKIRMELLNHEAARSEGHEGATVEHLQSRLLDMFGDLNRDWRRVALTECSRNANEGYLGALRPGSKVRRVEFYETACDFCRSIHNRIFTVVDPVNATDGESQVWVGKTNIGRSASPRKRVGNLLVEREPEELWWVTAGPAHPMCRGTWAPVPGKEQPGVDREFSDWLERELQALRS